MTAMDRMKWQKISTALAEEAFQAATGLYYVNVARP